MAVILAYIAAFPVVVGNAILFLAAMPGAGLNGRLEVCVAVVVPESTGQSFLADHVD